MAQRRAVRSGEVNCEIPIETELQQLGEWPDCKAKSSIAIPDIASEILFQKPLCLETIKSSQLTSYHDF